MSVLKIKTYDSVQSFFDDNLTFLEKEEAANNLIIGIPNAMRNMPMDEKKLRLLAVTDNDIPVICVAQTPPRNLIMYVQEEKKAAFDHLITFLLENKYEVNGVVGPREVMTAFSNQWTQRTKQKWDYNFRQLAYQLDTLIDVPISKGNVHVAKMKDHELLSKWFYDFLVEALGGEETENAAAIAKNKIEKGEVYVWENGEVVSMACSARPTRHCVTVNYVYTPKAFRGHGYASSVTHHLTRDLLKQYTLCALFTDMSNPTSNSIYKKMGYREVAKYVAIDFVFEG